jgi:TolA-binding protein
MKPWKLLPGLTHLATATALCLVAAWPIYADDTAKAKPAATPASPPAQTAASAQVATAVAVAPTPVEAAPAPPRAEQPAPSDPVEKELVDETSKLQKMEAELKALESTPIPSAEAPAVKAPVVKPAPNPGEIPKEPAKGLEEEYANALYAMGKYDLARVAYQRVVESKPQADILAWARLQVANCARHTGDLQSAGAAYEALMNTSPTSPWASEATWWAGEIKWWSLWQQSAK